MKFNNIILIIFTAVLSAALTVCAFAQGSVNSNNDAPAGTNGGYGDTNGVFDSDGDSAVRDDPATEYNESDEISSGMYESDGMTDSSDEHRTAVDPAMNTMAPESAMAGGGAMTAVLAITAAIAAALLLIFGFAANRKLER